MRLGIVSVIHDGQLSPWGLDPGQLTRYPGPSRFKTTAA